MNKNKFRAYDKENHRWVDCNILLGYDGSLWWNFGYKLEILNPNEAKKIDVQFSIGEEDKNNKEIYEGDIVKKSYRNGFSYGIIRYFQYRYVFEFLPNLPHEYVIGLHSAFLKNGKTIDWYELEEIMNDNLEIIGNVYDNPKLLKEV